MPGDEREEGREAPSEPAGATREERAVPGVAEPVRRRTRPARRVRLEFGGVIGRSLRAWSANLLPFVTLTAIAYLPYVGGKLWVQSEPRSREFEALWDLASLLLNSLLGFVVTGAVIVSVFRELRGRKTPFGELLSEGARRLPAVLATAGAAGACCAAPLLAPAALLALSFPVLATLLLPVAFVLAVMVWCGSYLAVPAVVVERPGVIGALRRSWQLTSGYRWNILFIAFVFGLAAGIATGVIGGFAYLATGVDFDWIALVIALFTNSLQAVVIAVVYHDLRAGNEGLDAEELARIFE